MNKKSVVLFTLSRYVSFGMLVARGFLVASVLGPYLFGVWSFLSLTQQYLSYSGLGLQYAINIELATRDEASAREDSRTIGNALALTLLVAMFLALLGLGAHAFHLRAFEKYSFQRYVPAIVIIASLNLVYQVLINVYRVYGRLARIAVADVISAFVPLAVVFMFHGEGLLLALLIALACSAIISIALLTVRAPFGCSLSLDRPTATRLLALGIPLLIYNASFYFINMVPQTIVSIFYPAHIMGYYSLATGMSNATLLGFNMVSWVFFPEVLSRTRPGLDDGVAARAVVRVNDLFGTAVLVSVLAAAVFLPVLFRVLPQYKEAESTLAILLLSQAVLALSFGHNCLALARKQHMAVARISAVAVAVVAALSLGVVVSGLSFVWIAVAVLVGTLVFTVLQTKVASPLVETDQQTLASLKTILPLGVLVSVLLCLAGSAAGYTSLGGLAGLAAFTLTNRSKVASLWSYLRRHWAWSQVAVG